MRSALLTGPAHGRMPSPDYRRDKGARAVQESTLESTVALFLSRESGQGTSSRGLARTSTGAVRLRVRYFKSLVRTTFLAQPPRMRFFWVPGQFLVPCFLSVSVSRTISGRMPHARPHRGSLFLQIAGICSLLNARFAMIAIDWLSDAKQIRWAWVEPFRVPVSLFVCHVSPPLPQSGCNVQGGIRARGQRPTEQQNAMQPRLIASVLFPCISPPRQRRFFPSWGISHRRAAQWSEGGGWTGGMVENLDLFYSLKATSE